MKLLVGLFALWAGSAVAAPPVEPGDFFVIGAAGGYSPDQNKATFAATLGYWHEWERFGLGVSALAGGFPAVSFAATINGAWYVLPGPFTPYLGAGAGVVVDNAFCTSSSPCPGFSDGDGNVKAGPAVTGEVGFEFRRESTRVQFAAQVLEPLFSVANKFELPQGATTQTLWLFWLRVLI